MDFLSLLDQEQGAEVLNQWVPRAHLGLHLRLAALAGEVEQALTDKSPQLVADKIRDYLSLTGLSADDATGVQQLLAYISLLELNTIQFTFAFQYWQGDPDHKPPPYQYPGRAWAWWVHKLASRYGWTREYIFDHLWPEEAAAYIQEILVSEYDEADEARSMSKLGYHYDEKTQIAKFVPLPRPSWMKEKEKPQTPRRVRRDMLPIGNVIDLTHKSDDDFEILH